MKIENKIRKHLLVNMLEDQHLKITPLNTDEEVSEAYFGATEYEGIFEGYEIYDEEHELRCSGERVSIEGLKTPFSRHYESDRVAAKLNDGTYVSWIYWYGGGKHGEPELIDWMSEEDGACEVNCKEEEKLVIVREWSKKG